MTALDPDELPPELAPAERAALAETAAVLLAARPLPSAGFRGALRRSLAGRLAPSRPPRLRRRVAAFVVAGAVLLLLGASGLTGHGPLAPPAVTAVVR
jgi:hypothetical protein